MIPAPFSYQRAGSVEEALELVAEHGDDAKFLAGGHSLLPLMKLRLAAAGTTPPADNNASSGFRQHLARVVVRRALEQAATPA